MKLRFIVLFCAVALFSIVKESAADVSVAHDFGVPAGITGFAPESALVQDASGALYGTTSASEGNWGGTIFKIQPDGTGFQVLMNFGATTNFTNSSGATPYGGLVLSGTTLYGTTYNGGSGGSGTIFSISTSGTGFKVLTNFPPVIALTNSVGAHPYGGLTLSGSILYGTTQAGGTGGEGTVFSVNVNGAGLAVLKTFSAAPTGANSDGALPDGTLLLTNGILYGTTIEGGAYGLGTVFSLNPGTLAYAVIHAFTGGSDGANPHAGLSTAGGLFYGTASGGGNGYGTIFMLTSTGSPFSTLYAFTNGVDQAAPYGGVICAGAKLYGATFGTTFDTGALGFGTVFSVNTNGGGFANLYTFNGTVTGANPIAGLFLSGSTLYGTTAGTTGQEDSAGGDGTIFAVGTSTLGFTNLYTFIYSDAAGPRGSLILSGNTLYGATVSGGTNGNGAIFSMAPGGSSYSVIKTFSSFGYNPAAAIPTNADGASPAAGVVLGGGTLYGVATQGGLYGYGVVFSVNTNGLNFTNLHNFTDASDGANPEGMLVLSGNTLYGTTVNGGAAGSGVVFSINTNGGAFTILKTFSASGGGANADGANPFAGLLLSNTTLYGTTANGGLAGVGTIFSLTTGGSFSSLYSFTGGADGANPYGPLALAGSALYGTTYYGGTNFSGTVFMMPLGGSPLVSLRNFSALGQDPLAGISTNADGANPFGGLTLIGSQLYGTTVNGGANGLGTVFTLDLIGSSASFADLHDFDGPTGANPYANLLWSNGVFYGDTAAGGTVGDGVVFSLAAPGSGVPLNIQRAGTVVVLTWSNPTYVLQTAATVNGAYTTIANATSPYTNSITGSQQYFRLVGSQ